MRPETLLVLVMAMGIGGVVGLAPGMRHHLTGHAVEADTVRGCHVGMATRCAAEASGCVCSASTRQKCRGIATPAATVPLATRSPPPPAWRERPPVNSGSSASAGTATVARWRWWPA